ncbi:MAG: hypothetical protein AAB913_01520 [Patescibacteria group bacterium]
MSSSKKSIVENTKVRTTIVIPLVVDSNLAVLVVRRSVSKSELFREGASDLLRKAGLDPTRMPKKITVEY